MEHLNLAILLKAHTRPVALDHLRACRDERLFNRGPLNRSRHGIGEDRGKGFAVFMVHRGI